jgi:hypothetical protein
VALEKQMPSYFAQLKKDASVVITDEKLHAALQKLEQERTTAN